MNKLNRNDLMTLEDYAGQRQEFRARVIEHKKNRQLPLGANATLYFEDRLTIQYQIQEMLRVERIFESAGIQDELDAYNPLIPDGTNLKATFMIEYPDVEQRRSSLADMIGIEDTVWLRVDGFDKVFAIADEDMDRETGDKTSAVHFLRFEFSQEMIEAARQGAALSAGIDHQAYTKAVDPLSDPVRESLVRDFN
jgi:hypothetical protein